MKMLRIIRKIILKDRIRSEHKIGLRHLGRLRWVSKVSKAAMLKKSHEENGIKKIGKMDRNHKEFPHNREIVEKMAGVLDIRITRNQDTKKLQTNETRPIKKKKELLLFYCYNHYKQ